MTWMMIFDHELLNLTFGKLESKRLNINKIIVRKKIMACMCTNRSWILKVLLKTILILEIMSYVWWWWQWKWRDATQVLQNQIQCNELKDDQQIWGPTSNTSVLKFLHHDKWQLHFMKKDHNILIDKLPSHFSHPKPLGIAICISNRNKKLQKLFFLHT